jgi:hypothetical protein
MKGPISQSVWRTSRVARQPGDAAWARRRLETERPAILLLDFDARCWSVAASTTACSSTAAPGIEGGLRRQSCARARPPDGKLTSVYRPPQPVFAGEMDTGTLIMLLTTIGSRGCFQLFEMNHATKACQVTPGEHADITTIRVIFPTATSRLPARATTRAALQSRGQHGTLGLLSRVKIRRIGFDQEYNWFPALNDGRVRPQYQDLRTVCVLFHIILTAPPNCMERS